jgi:hypothetical protein
MKGVFLSLVLLLSAALVSASDYSDRRILHIDMAEFPTGKVCIYKNEIFSEGSEIKMESQRLYRCERYQEGKTVQKDNIQLRWVAVTYDK